MNGALSLDEEATCVMLLIKTPCLHYHSAIITSCICEWCLVAKIMRPRAWCWRFNLFRKPALWEHTCCIHLRMLSSTIRLAYHSATTTSCMWIASSIDDEATGVMLWTNSFSQTCSLRTQVLHYTSERWAESVALLPRYFHELHVDSALMLNDGATCVMLLINLICKPAHWEHKCGMTPENVEQKVLLALLKSWCGLKGE